MVGQSVPQMVTVEVDRKPLRGLAEHLIEARVELSAGAAGHFMLRFLSDDGLDDAFSIGASVSISFDDVKAKPVKVFTGTIESLAIDYELDRRELTVSGYDGRHKISTAPTTTAHVNASYRDILNSIAGNAGLRGQIDAELDKIKYSHVLQVESDLAFVHRIARSRGLEWLVDDGKLIVRKRDAASTIKVDFGDRLRRLSARYSSAERPKGVEVRGWDPARKEAVVGDSESASLTSVGKVPVEERSRKKVSATRTGAVWGPVTISSDDAKAAANGYARRMASGELIGRGEALGDPAMKPGVNLEISGVDDDWNGAYYVTAVEHVYRRFEPYLTRFTIGAHDTSSLVDLLGAPGNPSTTAASSARSFGQGVTIGIVTNTANDERKHAEVKVKFPYLDAVESQWARLVSPGAGKDRGLMFVPEVNDEVIVAFEHGDPTRPYVLGGVWNGKDAPPLDPNDSKQKDQRAIVSTTNHRLTFSDGGSDSEKYVSVVLGDGKTTLMLGHDKIEVIANNGKPIEIKNDKAKVVMTGSGDVTIEGNNITLKAKQKVTVEGAEIATKAQAKTDINAGAQFNVSSTGKAAIDGGGMTEIKGGMVKVN